jgi:3'-phosphoadenosine 5'-phosphosulfate sulfotransferase (PAPS reductase)/FAD synthetase
MNATIDMFGGEAKAKKGGRTSAYLLNRVLESNGGLPDGTQVLFANTGLEHEATLEFVATIGDRWGVPITWIEYRPEAPGYAIVGFESAARNGEPYESMIRKERFIPTPVQRICTSRLKIRAMHKHLAVLGWKDGDGWDQFIGIRADEPGRVAKIRARGVSTEDADETMVMPLAEAGVTKGDVGAFWKRQPFDLKLPNHNGVTKHGNCVLCFLKPGAQVLSLIQEEPTRAIWWARMETDAQSHLVEKRNPDGWRFRNDRPSYAQMHAYALAQDDLFQKADPKQVTDDLMAKLMADDGTGIDCFCGNDDA